MVVGSLVSRKQCDEVFLNHHNNIIWSLDCQCHGLILLSATTCIDKLRMDSSRDRESVLRRRRERYRLQRERETPEEREVRLARRRELYRRRSCYI